MTASNVEPTLANTEPITLTEAVRSLFTATLSVLFAFNVLHMTGDQISVVLAEFTAGSVFLSALARAKSVPASKVALTTKQADLIAAVTTPAPANPAAVAAPTTPGV